MITVGIVGASGYMGGEVLRVLMDHPEVDIAWATSRSGGRIEEYHPNLYDSGIELIHPDRVTPCDVVFLALPTAASICESARFLSMGAKVIDLGSAFRLQDRATWERVYGQKHGQWTLAEQAVYGINELHRADVENASLIANPGCFSSAAILALAPLMEEGLVETEKLVVTGISGTAGQCGGASSQLRNGTGTVVTGRAGCVCAFHAGLCAHRARHTCRVPCVSDKEYRPGCLA